MTKSQGFSANRRTFIKSVRAKSHREGTSFRRTLESVSDTTAAKKALMRTADLDSAEKRNMRRPWYSDALTVDDGNYVDDEDDDPYDFEAEFLDAQNSKHHTQISVHLLEIAQPSRKSKGAARDFEVIKKSRPTSLEDEEFEIWEDDVFEIWDDEWEKIYDEEHVDSRKTYSSVLRGNER